MAAWLRPNVGGCMVLALLWLAHGAGAHRVHFEMGHPSYEVQTSTALAWPNVAEFRRSRHPSGLFSAHVVWHPLVLWPLLIGEYTAAMALGRLPWRRWVVGQLEKLPGIGLLTVPLQAALLLGLLRLAVFGHVFAPPPVDGRLSEADRFSATRFVWTPPGPAEVVHGISETRSTVIDPGMRTPLEYVDTDAYPTELGRVATVLPPNLVGTSDLYRELPTDLPKLLGTLLEATGAYQVGKPVSGRIVFAKRADGEPLLFISTADLRGVLPDPVCHEWLFAVRQWADTDETRFTLLSERAYRESAPYSKILVTAYWAAILWCALAWVGPLFILWMYKQRRRGA